MTTEQEVKATLERATEWLDKQRREYGSLPSYSDELINDLVQLVETLGDKSIARTGEPLGERDSVDAARYRWLRSLMGGNRKETWERVEELGALNAWVGWDEFDAAIDAAMGAKDKKHEG